MGCMGVSGVSPEKWLHSRQWAWGPLERDSTQKYCLEGRKEAIDPAERWKKLRQPAGGGKVA